MPHNNLKKCIINSLFISLSITLGLFGKISMFPSLPFLKLDFSDIPIYISAITLGPYFGIISLVIASFLRAILFSSAGFLGFLIRISLMPSVFILGAFYNKSNKKILKSSVYLLTVISATLPKIIISYAIWNKFFGISENFLNQYIYTIALPYNFIKSLLSVLFSILLSHLFLKNGAKTFDI